MHDLRFGEKKAKFRPCSPVDERKRGGGGRRVTKAPLVKFLGIFKVNYTVLYAYLGYYEYIILTV